MLERGSRADVTSDRDAVQRRVERRESNRAKVEIERYDATTLARRDEREQPAPGSDVDGEIRPFVREARNETRERERVRTGRNDRVLGSWAIRAIDADKKPRHGQQREPRTRGGSLTRDYAGLEQRAGRSPADRAFQITPVDIDAHDEEAHHDVEARRTRAPDREIVQVLGEKETAAKRPAEHPGHGAPVEPGLGEAPPQMGESASKPWAAGRNRYWPVVVQERLSPYVFTPPRIFNAFTLG
jgi:hypothetical protein